MFSSSVAVAAPSSGIALRGSWAGPSSRTDDWFTAGRRKMVVPLGDPDPRVPSAGPARPAAQEATANVLGEDLFRSVLSRERKRADRFDDVFALVTITLGNGSASPATDPRFELVISALAASTRGADVVGWVEEGAVLGVIFADLGSPAKEVARQTQARVQQNLTDRLDPSQLASLGVQWYVHLGPGAEGAHGLADTDPLLADIRSSQRRRSVLDALKRAFDIAGSLALLLILSPVFLALAALVKLTSEGPVLFRQGRVGLMATPFTMLKFRSMYTKSDSAIHQKFVTDFIKSGSQQGQSSGEQIFKIVNDPRVTPLGAILRKTSLDELPQLWNVLRGDMSLVGPRPPLRYELEQYRPWHWRRVLEAKPGVTGLWQVAGRSRTTFDEMVRLDLRYVRTRSLWADIKILLATPRAVVTGKGAC